MQKLFESIETESSEIVGKIKGTIPTWVNGSLYRNGPMQYNIGDYKMKHLFDGMAAVQRWNIKNGKVTYQRKLVQSETLRKNLNANRIIVSEFGTGEMPDPCQNILQRFFSYFTPSQITDNTIVTIWPQRDRLFVSTEAESIHEIDPDTLDTVDSVHLSDCLVINTATAHTHWDEDGTVHCFGFRLQGWRPQYTLFTIPPLSDSKQAFGNVKTVGSIPSRWPLHPGYIHSFSITEHYYVFLEQTLTFDIPKMAAMKMTTAGFENTMSWYPEEKTLFHIVKKTTGEKVNPDINYFTDPQFTWHHINAYEDKGSIVLDICSYDDPEIIKQMYLRNWKEDTIDDTMKNLPCAAVKRYILPIVVPTNVSESENIANLPGCKAEAIKVSPNEIYCRCEVIDTKGLDLPQINYQKFNGRKYKYVYGNGRSFFTSIRKINLETKECFEWEEEGCVTSEPVFIPHPDAKHEDDGVVLTAVSSCDEKENAFLMVLDGVTFTEIARVEFPMDRFPTTFHGFFRPDVRSTTKTTEQMVIKSEQRNE